MSEATDSADRDMGGVVTDQLMSTVQRQAPWKKGVGWPVVGVEGLILVGIGLFILIDQDTARDAIFQLIGVVMLASSVLIVSRSIRNPADPIAPYAMLRAGIGGTVGVLAVMRWFSDYLDNHAIRLILGWGLVAYTVVHLAGIVIARGREGLNLGGLITSGLTIVLGITLLTGKDDASGGRLNLLGTILLVFGVLLLAFAYYLYQKKDEMPADAATPPVQEEPPVS